jgi:hypothetical protein
MLDGIPLLLRSAMHVHIVLPVLHYELLEFPDTLKLHKQNPAIRQPDLPHPIRTLRLQLSLPVPASVRNRIAEE